MAARKKVIEQLEALGLLLKTEDYTHKVGYSERSKVPIEPCLSEQWFLKYPERGKITRGSGHRRDEVLS